MGPTPTFSRPCTHSTPPCFPTSTHEPAGAAEGLGRHHSRSSDRIVALSGIPTNPCTLPWGDHFVSLATQNKQDWARLHGYEFHVMAASTDVRIRPGPWQKIAMMRQVGRRSPFEGPG